jgi:hypothetical protein
MSGRPLFGGGIHLRLCWAQSLAALLFAMPVVAEDSSETQATAPQTTATVTDTTERVECNAVAVIVSGRRVPGFEATARGPDGATACRVALQQCQAMLEKARESTGLDLPSAECQPLETVQLIPDPVDATETAAAPGNAPTIRPETSGWTLLQHQCLFTALSLVPCVRLHLPAL